MKKKVKLREKEIYTEEEMEETFAFVDAIADLIKEKSEDYDIKNIEKYYDKEAEKEVFVCYKAAQQLVKETGGEVKYKLHEPFPFFGSVSIRGKNLKFKDKRKFEIIGSFASNTDIYKTTDGYVHIDFSFQNLVKGI